MCAIRHVEGQLHVDQVSVNQIADNIPTPFYVYSGQRIAEKFGNLKGAFIDLLPANKQPILAYACKANSNIAVLKLLASLGAGADVVTGGELSRALKAGIDANKIVFSGVGKTDEELLLAIKSQILQINVESFPELVRIGELASSENKTVRVAFRVNPDVDAGTHEKITTGKKENKFGIPLDEILDTYSYASKHDHIEPQGLSVHIGSQLTDVSPFKDAFVELARITQSLIDEGYSIHTIDVGGGLGIVYNNEAEPKVNEYAQIVVDALKHFDAQLILEPGRYVVGDAGALITKVTYLKQNKSGKNYLILDAGMNDLLRPTLYDAYHPIDAVNKASDQTMVADVVGPICETGDTFAKDLEITKIQQGDLVTIRCSGAYGSVMASNYNTRGLTTEVLVKDDKFAVIRKAQTFDDLIANEVVPNWV